MKTVIISGGTRGIGRACAERFSSEGFNVAVLYNNSVDAASELERRLGAFCITCDVSSSGEIKAAVESVKARFGNVDVLVNNAGISHSGLLQDMTDDEWQTLMGVNLSSVFYLSREVIPMMLNRGGSIINISSMWGVVGASCEAAYSASKAGVIGLTKALAKELAPSGIRVNSVAPGAVMTDMMKEYSDSDIKAICEKTPLERLGKPEEIAEAVWFLASERSGFITGEVLNVNGGFVI